MSRKVALSIAYVAILVELAVFLARHAGRISDGGLYTALLLMASAVLFGAVARLAYLRSHTENL